MEPEIREMREDEWISPEEERFRQELMKEQLAQARKAVLAEEFRKEVKYEGRRLHSTLSDAVLATTCLVAAFALSHDRAANFATVQIAVTGFFAIAVAALCGCLRFGGVFPSIFVRVHDFMSAFATLVGLPCIAAGALLLTELHVSAPRFNQVLPLIVTAGFLLTFQGYGEKVGKLLSTAGGGVIGFTSLSLLFRVGAVVPALLLLAGLVGAIVAGGFLEGDKRERFFVPGLANGVDVFHYIFSVALAVLAFGVLQLSATFPSPSPWLLSSFQ